MFALTKISEVWKLCLLNFQLEGFFEPFSIAARYPTRLKFNLVLIRSGMVGRLVFLSPHFK